MESVMKFGLYSLSIGVSVIGLIACGSSRDPSTVSSDGIGGGTGTGASSGAGDLRISPDSGGSASAGSSGSQQVTCDAGHCTCSGSNTTTIEGYVYDPAGKNPLYNVSVYVPDPSSPLPDLDTVPLACGCSQLYPAKVLATGSPTDATGHFEIPCAPSGTVSLVVQTGKWRMQYNGIAVTANQPNMAPKLRLPANSTEGSLPNIAISTGGADSLECLPLRIGVASSEYVLGSATGGHIHIYTGYHGATMAQGSVDSYQTLWDQQAHLNEHDVVLLSCEGHETTGGAPGVPMNSMFQRRGARLRFALSLRVVQHGPVRHRREHTGHVDDWRATDRRLPILRGRHRHDARRRRTLSRGLSTGPVAESRRSANGQSAADLVCAEQCAGPSATTVC
jgi:hypothetical protein